MPEPVARSVCGDHGLSGGAGTSAVHGVSRRHLVLLVGESAVPWQAGVEGRRHAARGGARKRPAGAGARHQLVFVDRLAATLIHPRHDLPHSVPGPLFDVGRSTITRAIAETRTLLAERGCAVPDQPRLRLRTLADVFAYAQAEGIELRLDATEIQVRRPPAGCGGRRAFVPGRRNRTPGRPPSSLTGGAARHGPPLCGLAARTMPRPPATRASPSASSTSPTSRSSWTTATSA